VNAACSNRAGCSDDEKEDEQFNDSKSIVEYDTASSSKGVNKTSGDSNGYGDAPNCAVGKGIGLLLGVSSL